VTVSAARRALAWVVLATFAATFGFGTTVPGHTGGDDDAACNPGASAAHPVSQIERVKPPSAPAHCPFCHWQRVVGGASLDAGLSAAQPLESVQRITSAAAGLVPSVSLTDRASRAPPAGVLFL
jgi:hypothetical protein